jgi:rubrerythrin
MARFLDQDRVSRAANGNEETMDGWEHGRAALAGIEVGDGDRLSRADVLLKGALGAGALYGLGAVAPYVRTALAAERKKDVDVLGYLLPFEYLQASIYNRGSTEKNDYGEKMSLKSNKPLVEALLSEEGQHITALTELIEELGGKPPAKGEYAFAFRSLEVFLQMSAEIEGFAIGAYNGAIGSLESQAARELAASIVQVEGRHEATLRIAGGEPPAPQAVDPGLSEDVAINAVGRFTGVFS